MTDTQFYTFAALAMAICLVALFAGLFGGEDTTASKRLGVVALIIFVIAALFLASCTPATKPSEESLIDKLARPFVWGAV